MGKSSKRDRAKPGLFNGGPPPHWVQQNKNQVEKLEEMKRKSQQRSSEVAQTEYGPMMMHTPKFGVDLPKPDMSLLETEGDGKHIEVPIPGHPGAHLKLSEREYAQAVQKYGDSTLQSKKFMDWLFQGADVEAFLAEAAREVAEEINAGRIDLHDPVEATCAEE
tara:strand:+ start:663 stop:1154 length:492 start_codon:yes stop_codon:yes gene_type:complete